MHSIRHFQIPMRRPTITQILSRDETKKLDRNSNIQSESNTSLFHIYTFVIYFIHHQMWSSWSVIINASKPQISFERFLISQSFCFFAIQSKLSPRDVHSNSPCYRFHSKFWWEDRPFTDSILLWNIKNLAETLIYKGESNTSLFHIHTFVIYFIHHQMRSSWSVIINASKPQISFERFMISQSFCFIAIQSKLSPRDIHSNSPWYGFHSKFWWEYWPLHGFYHAMKHKKLGLNFNIQRRIEYISISYLHILLYTLFIIKCDIHDQLSSMRANLKYRLKDLWSRSPSVSFIIPNFDGKTDH